MNPAFSVIFFTTLSGAGYGLLACTAFALLAGSGPSRPLLVAVLLALLLVTTGLLSSLLHLGKPQRAWRALSQWRTSWLSREGVLALATYLPALGVTLALLVGQLQMGAAGAQRPSGALVWALCLLLILSALATVACTAMIYASLKPIPAWRHRLVVPGYLLFALLTGGLLLGAITEGSGHGLGNMPAAMWIVIAILLAALKLKYWRDLDAAPLPQTRGDAVGLPARAASVFERPHTEANYITREMGFVVARRHARPLRIVAVLLFALVPILLMLPAWLFVHVDATPLFAVAAASALAGAIVERWLFFAQARHMVTLYY